MTETEDMTSSAFLEFLSAVEAGVAAARQIIKDSRVGWEPDNIRWEPAQGSAGPYERSEDSSNPEFRLMVKDLQAHGGRLTVDGYFYWEFKNGAVVGRKRRSQTILERNP